MPLCNQPSISAFPWWEGATREGQRLDFSFPLHTYHQWVCIVLCCSPIRLQVSIFLTYSWTSPAAGGSGTVHPHSEGWWDRQCYSFSPCNSPALYIARYNIWRSVRAVSLSSPVSWCRLPWTFHVSLRNRSSEWITTGRRTSTIIANHGARNICTCI